MNQSFDSINDLRFSMNAKISLQQIVAHAKAYGFIYNSSELYGGLQAVYDYGPYGVLLKRRIQEFWWKTMTQVHDNIVGLDAAILMAPATWKASGHATGFHDWLVDHKVSKKRYRVDVLLESCASTLRKQGKDVEADDLLASMGKMMESRDGAGLTSLLRKYNVVCPVGKTAEWLVAREFDLMLMTQLGSVQDTSQKIYLRPETAQGIFVNFIQVQETARLKVPFGIAQIGKAFRNETGKGPFIFRMCEFEQMEMQFFVPPSEADKWFNYWLKVRKAWYGVLGITNIRAKEHDQLAHYADAAMDIEYEFSFGYKEVEGVHNRTDYDLKNHSLCSKKGLQYFDPQKQSRYLPYVIETSAGCDRLVLMLLCHAMRQEKKGNSLRMYLSFPPALAPIHAAVLPLVKKPELIKIARDIWRKLRYSFLVMYDDRGSIGRRYTRQDLLGTPCCITVDFDTLQDKKVTIRDRDTMQQVRVGISEVACFLEKRVSLTTLLEQVDTTL